MEPESSVSCSQEPTSVPCPSQMNPIHPSHPVPMKCIPVLSSHRRLDIPGCLFPSGLPLKIQYAFLLSPMHAASLAHLIATLFWNKLLACNESCLCFVGHIHCDIVSLVHPASIWLQYFLYDSRLVLSRIYRFRACFRLVILTAFIPFRVSRLQFVSLLLQPCWSPILSSNEDDARRMRSWNCQSWAVYEGVS